MKIKKEILDKIKDYCDRNHMEFEPYLNGHLDQWINKKLDAEREFHEYVRERKNEKN
jgi:hypothetical protein